MLRGSSPFGDKALRHRQKAAAATIKSRNPLAMMMMMMMMIVIFWHGHYKLPLTGDFTHPPHREEDE
jgi:hypothetical protein